jgi:hypothetical protein
VDDVVCEYYLVHTHTASRYCYYIGIRQRFWQVLLLGLTMWVEVARVVRGQVISVKEMQYVTAARALGLGFRIIFNHIHLISWRQLLLFRCTRISYISGKRFKLSWFRRTPHTYYKDHYSYIILRIWLWFLVWPLCC